MILSILIVILLMVGVFFFTVGTIGLLRLPEVYTRLHATTKCDTLGACSILLGMMLYEGIAFASVEMLFIIAFLLLANPTAAHAIARGSYKRGFGLWEGTGVDMYRGVVTFYTKPTEELVEESK
ncbi:MAG: monovalent cation/H(+) antiporter subunit G [Methanocellales archaeon]|nr:monovalent cation/H(+) antiporter subunit G [Methanocellales archaeon]